MGEREREGLAFSPLPAPHPQSSLSQCGGIPRLGQSGWELPHTHAPASLLCFGAAAQLSSLLLSPSPTPSWADPLVLTQGHPDEQGLSWVCG